MWKGAGGMALNCCQREASVEYLVSVSHHFLKETEMDKEFKVLRVTSNIQAMTENYKSSNESLSQWEVFSGTQSLPRLYTQGQYDVPYVLDGIVTARRGWAQDTQGHRSHGGAGGPVYCFSHLVKCLGFRVGPQRQGIFVLLYVFPQFKRLLKWLCGLWGKV